MIEITSDLKVIDKASGLEVRNYSERALKDFYNLGELTPKEVEKKINDHLIKQNIKTQYFVKLMELEIVPVHELLHKTAGEVFASYEEAKKD